MRARTTEDGASLAPKGSSSVCFEHYVNTSTYTHECICIYACNMHEYISAHLQKACHTRVRRNRYSRDSLLRFLFSLYCICRIFFVPLDECPELRGSEAAVRACLLQTFSALAPAIARASKASGNAAAIAKEVGLDDVFVFIFLWM